jgi:hypothetical protein
MFILKPWHSESISAVGVLDAYCAPSGNDPTGTVASGHILLRGKAFGATLFHSSNSAETGFLDDRFNISLSHDRFIDNHVHFRLKCNFNIRVWESGSDHLAVGATGNFRLLYTTFTVRNPIILTYHQTNPQPKKVYVSLPTRTSHQLLNRQQFACCVSYL